MSSAITPDQPFDDELKSKIRDQLLEVLDPCSCMSEHPVNIVDLGLVDEITVDDGAVEVVLLLTSQRCTYFLDMNDEIRERVGALPEVDSVEVHQDTSGEIWTHERMSERERTARRQRFYDQMEAAGITPYAERSQ
ncbi:metal-sulfur cluster assembly factor [Natronomonas sp. EA1]|uniref:metal-sulfur cluster assembly factor n=1 Tax=Natronomonas sp. EA1 TaxID=3421655 RepID=UPI003EBA0B01